MFRVSQIQAVVKGVPWGAFDRIVEQYDGNRYAKHFQCRDQLVAMVYAQLAGADSLRTIEAGFNQHASHHYHLGCSTLRRSTLADANRRRDPAVFEELARSLMSCASRPLRRQAAELLYLLDSTSLTLPGPGFDDWTLTNKTRFTQGLKVHVLYEADQALPCQVKVTAPNVNDVEEGRRLPIQAGATYVFDKGYYDFNWWHRIDQAGACFVTRYKSNVALEVVEERPVETASAHVLLGDAIVRFSNRYPGGGRRNDYAKPLRRITVARSPQEKPLVLATNDLTSPAETIAQRYKERWQIELFFKWIKQHLKLKKWLGRSENAVRIQILTALIAYLLVALYKAANGLKESLWIILATLRAGLFQRADTEREIGRRRRRKREELARLQPRLFA
jgi:putative transposase